MRSDSSPRNDGAGLVSQASALCQTFLTLPCSDVLADWFRPLQLCSGSSIAEREWLRESVFFGSEGERQAPGRSGPSCFFPVSKEKQKTTVAIAVLLLLLLRSCSCCVVDTFEVPTLPLYECMMEVSEWLRGRDLVKVVLLTLPSRTGRSVYKGPLI